MVHTALFTIFEFASDRRVKVGKMVGEDQTGIVMNRSLSRRSPSILVTDARSTKNRSSAPFAGHAAGMRRASPLSRGSEFSEGLLDSKGNRVRRRGYDLFSNKKAPSGRFSDVSMDNILLEVSDVPSGRRQERLSASSADAFPSRHRGAHLTKMINPLPARTSKTSQKLVLIPDEEHDKKPSSQFRKRVAKGQRLRSTSRAKMDKEVDLPRLTAYNVAEGFNLSSTSKFLKQTHDVSPRLYDECLYVPYCLPLLPGKDGFRIKSNLSKRTRGGKTIIESLIDTSEQRDHHYEYYSGVETVEDMNNNYELDEGGITNNLDAINTPNHLPNPSANTFLSFDPSEPQYFAEENDVDTEDQPFSTERPNDKPLFQQEHAEIFIFSYGVIVFWNFTEIQEKNILGDIAFSNYKNMVIKPLDEQDIEIESFQFEYDMETERPRIFNDIITLRSGDHLTALTLSHAIAQSVKLSRFEARIVPIFGSVSKLPKRLALYGTLGLKREQLLKKSGKLFKLRVDVNLSSSILDTPEFFWSFEPSLHSLYAAMREYLEIDPRVQVLNDRCKVFLEFFDICVDSIAERNMARITWWFITVIFISVLISIVEILVRYFIIKKHKSG